MTERHYTGWTHLADFVFERNGRLSGAVVARSHVSPYLIIFEDEIWQDLRTSVEPSVSTCQLKALATYSQQLSPTKDSSIEFIAPRFSKYHVFVADVSAACSEHMILLRQWRSTKRRGPTKILHRLFSNRLDFLHPSGQPVMEATKVAKPTSVISYHLHFVNAQFGFLMEFPSDELLIFPISVLFLLIFTLLIRFQIASVRLLWANTGVSLASTILFVLIFKWTSLFFGCIGLSFFAMHGVDFHSGPHNMKLASLLLDGLFNLSMLVMLIATSKGWMITTPTLFADPWTKLQFGVLILNAFASFTSLARFLFPMTTEQHSSIFADLVVGSSHLYVFVSSYSDLVNLMRRSRLHVGAKPRARAFNAVAAMLLIWALTPVFQVLSSHLLAFWLEPFIIISVTLGLQAFSSIVMVWAFRPELLWELHGERPQLSTGKLFYPTPDLGKKLQRFDDSLDELDGLLSV